MSSPAHPSTAGEFTRTRPPGTIRIGRFAGGELYISRTWFVVAAFVAVVVAIRLDQVQPGLGPWKYLAGLAFAVVLYAAVLLHEGAHAVMAGRYGLMVESITLHFLGGVTHIDGSARSPRQEFWIAVVGPMTSVAIGGAALAAWTVVPPGLLAEGLLGLAGVNLLIGVLNLIPGLPLDGGRVLKASVWQLTGSPHRGTIVAGWAGRVVAVMILGWPWLASRWWDVEITWLDYALVFVIAVFLWLGATKAMAHARARNRIPRLHARALAKPIRAESIDRPRHLGDGVRLPADLSGEALILAISRRPAVEYVLVEPDGEVVGLLATADVDRAFREGRG